MASNTTTPASFADSFNDALRSFDDDNAAELTLLKNFIQLKDAHLAKQVDFFAGKYGPDDERIAIARNRIAYDASLLTQLDTAVAEAGFIPPAFDAGGWRVQGFVYDGGGNKKTGITVLLAGAEKMDALKDVEPVVSDANGYYSITIDAREIAALKSTKLAVAVLQKKKIVPVSDPFSPVSGAIDYLDILQA